MSLYGSFVHPPIYSSEVIQTPTDGIIVMEESVGGLFQYIVESGRLPENEARRFFQQIMYVFPCLAHALHTHATALLTRYGVAHAHSLKVVHRDIKPENVLL